MSKRAILVVWDVIAVLVADACRASLIDVGVQVLGLDATVTRVVLAIVVASAH